MKKWHYNTTRAMDPTHLHVVSNMTFIDVFAVNLTAQLLLILLEASNLMSMCAISRPPSKAPCSSQQTEAGLKQINCMLPNSIA